MSIVNLNSNTVRVPLRLFQLMASVFVETWLEAFVNKPSQNMNAYVRWELFIIGCLFLGVTMSVDTQLHWLVLLPLFSIYLILTAIIGYEPLYSLVQRLGAYMHKHTLIPKLPAMPYGRAAVLK